MSLGEDRRPSPLNAPPSVLLGADLQDIEHIERPPRVAGVALGGDLPQGVVREHEFELRSRVLYALYFHLT